MTNEQKLEIEQRAEQKLAEEHTVNDRERNSAAVYRNIANDILPLSVKMVEDIPGNHSDGYLPILDTQMAVKNGKFTFLHYSKPRASLDVTLERSSMSMSAKLNILTAEGCRRLRNCSLDTPWSTQVKFLNKLMISMMWGGYTPKVREVVARRILAKYTNNLQNFREQG